MKWNMSLPAPFQLPFQPQNQLRASSCSSSFFSSLFQLPSPLHRNQALHPAPVPVQAPIPAPAPAHPSSGFQHPAQLQNQLLSQLTFQPRNRAWTSSCSSQLLFQPRNQLRGAVAFNIIVIITAWLMKRTFGGCLLVVAFKNHISTAPFRKKSITLL
jgi:hypothetical protein